MREPPAISILRGLDVFLGSLTLLGALMLWTLATDRWWGFPRENALRALVLTVHGAVGIWLGLALRRRGRARLVAQVAWVLAALVAIPFAWRYGESGQPPWAHQEVLGMVLHASTLLPLLAPSARAHLR